MGVGCASTSEFGKGKRGSAKTKRGTIVGLDAIARTQQNDNCARLCALCLRFPREA